MISLYDKYYDILKHIFNIMNLTDNIELKEHSKKIIINTIDQLLEKDFNNKTAYENLLEEFGFLEKNIEIPTEENNIETLTEENNIETLTEENNIETSTEENNIETSTEEKEVDSTKISNEKREYNNIDEYIFYEIYKNANKLLGEEFQKIMVELIKSLKSNDEENIVLNKNKYDKFVDDNKSILDVEKMEEYYKKTYDEYKVVKENKTEEKTEEVLKINNVKRSYNSKLKNKALSLLSLVGIGSHTPTMATGIGVSAYSLYKKGIKNAKMLIESNGLKLDENDNLIDSNGKIINEEEIGKLKYNLIKKELLKINPNGRINANYKKNKLTSMLLSVPSKLFMRMKDKYGKISVNNEEVSVELKDMNKGLGIIK